MGARLQYNAADTIGRQHIDLWNVFYFVNIFFALDILVHEVHGGTVEECGVVDGPDEVQVCVLILLHSATDNTSCSCTCFFITRTFSSTLQQTTYHSPVLVFYNKSIRIHSATDNIPCSCTCFFITRKFSSTLQQTTYHAPVLVFLVPRTLSFTE